MRTLIYALLSLLATLPLQAQEQRPQHPADFLGHQVGASGELAGWSQITAYFDSLSAVSSAVRVERIGESVLGRPMIMAVITSPANHRRLDDIRSGQQMLADPRGVADAVIEQLIEMQPAVVFIGASLHGDEIMATQMSMELAYDLITEDGLKSTLENVAVLLVPSMNPDGLDITRDWWLRTRGSASAGATMPWLYHHYAGHDNNRDFFMVTQPETEAVTRVLYQEWFPQVVYDVHQMGGGGERFFIPPFADPLNPNVDPLLVRGTNLVGAQMALALSEEGKTGVSHRSRYDLWWHGGARTVPARHNMIGILSEAASADYGDPRELPAGSLSQPEVGSMYPEPWLGTVWTPRDIVEYELIASKALVRLLDRQKRGFIRNQVQVARRQITRGREENPFAYLIPADQRDPGSATELLQVLRRGGVEVHEAMNPISAGGTEYPRGSHVVLMAQPYRAHAKDLLEPQLYPNRRLYPDGPPAPPYDLAGWTLPMQMGVDAIVINNPFDTAGLRLVDEVSTPPGRIILGTAEVAGLALDPQHNGVHRAIHETLREGGTVTFASDWLEFGGTLRWPPGTPVVSGLPDLQTRADRWAANLGLDVAATSAPPRGRTIEQLRVALYKPWTASIDEGWTRWVFEQWEVPFDTIHDARIRRGSLRDDFDAIVIPSMTHEQIVNGPSNAHPEFAGGLGAAGSTALSEFVRSGGTLVLLDAASEFAIQELGVPVRNIAREQPENEPTAWYAPGSLLRVEWNSGHPVATGMPTSGAIFYARSPVFDVPTDRADVTVIARYPQDGILMSGFAQGQHRIAGYAAAVEAVVGSGRVVLFGFRPQHRGQPHLTFKPLFNALYR